MGVESQIGEFTWRVTQLADHQDGLRNQDSSKMQWKGHRQIWELLAGVPRLAGCVI